MQITPEGLISVCSYGHMVGFTPTLGAAKGIFKAVGSEVVLLCPFTNMKPPRVRIDWGGFIEHPCPNEPLEDWVGKRFLLKSVQKGNWLLEPLPGKASVTYLKSFILQVPDVAKMPLEGSGEPETLIDVLLMDF